MFFFIKNFLKVPIANDMRQILMKFANEICVRNYKEYPPAVRRSRNMLCKFICLPNENFYCFRFSFLSPDSIYQNTNMLILIEHVIYVCLFLAAEASLQQHRHRQRQSNSRRT